MLFHVSCSKNQHGELTCFSFDFDMAFILDA